MVGTEIWTFRYLAAADPPSETTGGTVDLTGFGVEALDGSIGKVDRASYETGSGSIVVDTGPWIFGRKVLLPAGVIDRVDAEEQKVYVHRTKAEIEAAPEYDEMLANDERYHSELGSYYGPDGPGFRELDDRPRQW